MPLSTFCARSIAEYLSENLEILNSNVNYIDSVFGRSKTMLASFYMNQIQGLHSYVKEDVLNALKKELEECRNCASNDYNKFSDHAHKILSICEMLTEFYLTLSKSIHQRDGLFEPWLVRTRFKSRSVYERLFKVLTAADAFFTDCIQRTVYKDYLFIMTFFGERELYTPRDLLLIPEYSDEYLLRRKRFSKIKHVTFISAPYNLYFHSRCMLMNAHEIAHNILYLSYMSNKDNVERIFDEICDNLSAELRFYEEVNVFTHLSELLCDILSTSLVGPMYPVASSASDLFYYHNIRILETHPPDIIRNLICIEYSQTYLGLGSSSLQEISAIRHFLRNQLNRQVGLQRYYDAISAELPRINEIVRVLISAPFYQPDLDVCIDIKKDLDKNDECSILNKASNDEYSPLTLASSIWLRRLREGRFSPTGRFNIRGVERHSALIFMAMRKWLEEYFVPTII